MGKWGPDAVCGWPRIIGHIDVQAGWCTPLPKPGSSIQGGQEEGPPGGGGLCPWEITKEQQRSLAVVFFLSSSVKSSKPSELTPHPLCKHSRIPGWSQSSYSCLIQETSAKVRNTLSHSILFRDNTHLPIWLCGQSLFFAHQSVTQFPCLPCTRHPPMGHPRVPFVVP